MSNEPKNISMVLARVISMQQVIGGTLTGALARGDGRTTIPITTPTTSWLKTGDNWMPNWTITRGERLIKSFGSLCYYAKTLKRLVVYTCSLTMVSPSQHRHSCAFTSTPDTRGVILPQCSGVAPLTTTYLCM